jgi:isochorismate synthase
VTVVEAPGAAGPSGGRTDGGGDTGGPAGVVPPAVAALLRSWTRPAPAVDPIALFAAAREQDLEAALWLQPSAGFALVGIGRAWSVEPAGAGRFARAAAAWRTCLDGAAIDVPAGAPRGVGPILLGGLGFTGAPAALDDLWASFGAASLVLPELTFARAHGATFVTIVEPVLEAAGADGPDARDGPAPRAAERRWEALAARAVALSPGTGAVIARPADAPLAVLGERPDRATWERLVGLFAGAVGRGRLDKVVLARRVDLRSPFEIDLENALRRLAAGAPEGTIFAFVRGGRTFLGATPERLVRTAGRDFETVAIAGSAPRGGTAAEDAALGAALFASEKEREEHAVVVEMLRASLSPLAERLEVAATPGILALRDVQHLVTPVRGRLRDQAGLLGLAERLHPTPAVGGEPRDLALEMIAEHEGIERGWYAGPIGWLGADGDGELMVALRCGLVSGRDAALFAGCGIVADSDPAREWEESRMKLRPVASALGREPEPRA